MAQREDDADLDPGTDHDEDSSFVATAREVIARRQKLLDALHK